MKPRPGFAIRRMKFESGFTLIETLVVCAVIALATGMMLVGYNIIDSRRLDAEVSKLNDWMSSVAESAVFQSTVLGIRAEDELLDVVAYFDDRWYRINGFEDFHISGNFQWDIQIEERIEFGQSLDESDTEREPFVAFLPSGQAMPAGQLNFSGQGREAASISWDENANFAIVQPDEDEQ